MPIVFISSAYHRNSFSLTKTQVSLTLSPLQYREGLKNREMGKEAPQIFRLERVAFVRDKGPSENGKYGAKPTLPRTDFSITNGINPDTGDSVMDYTPPVHEEYRLPLDAAQPDYQVKEITFTHHPDAAQYKGSDYSGAIRVERGITVEKAKEIAMSDPSIDYFVYTKGYCMVLEIPPEVTFDPKSDPLHLASNGSYRYDSGQPGQGYMRVFYHGDVVFFKTEGKWLGSAPGLADVYYKN